MAISKEYRIYGQLIVDFANAASTDEAGLKYFENVQKAFDLPFQFIDKAKNLFPTLKAFYSPLTKQEIKCLELVSEIKTTEREIASGIYNVSLKYDVYSNIFHVGIPQEKKIEYGSVGENYNADPVVQDLSIEKIEDMLISDNMHPDSKEHNKNILSSSLPKLFHLGDKIIALKEISKEKYQEIYSLEDTYANIKLEHDYIEDMQKKLKSFLKKIVQTRIPHEWKILNKTSFDEEYFTDRSDFSFLFLDKIYNSPITFCIIEFFHAAKNIEHLKKCTHCKKFYIANKLISTQIRCSKCSKKTRLTREENTEYQRKYRPIRKKQMMAKKRNAKIKELINSGHTREEAEKLVNNTA